jgi:hypothetical protein
MRTFITRALWGVVIGGGLAVLGTTVANAAETDGTDGLLSGTQAPIGIEVPVTVSGTSLSVLGDSVSSGAATVSSAGTPAPAAATTSGADGTAAGTQALVNVAVPVTVGGNAISVLGDSATTDATTTPAAGSGTETTDGATTSGTDGTASGTQVVAPIAVPVTVGGNAISVLGDSATTDATTTPAQGSGTGTTEGATTDGTDGTASGTQDVAPIAVPVTVGGNAISVLGDSATTDATTVPAAGSAGGTAEDATTSGDDAIAGGTQAVVPVTAPVTVAGNGISVLGDSTSDGAATVVPGGTGTGPAVTTGEGGVLGGTEVALPVTAPITLGGNAVSVIGDSTTTDPVTVPGTTDPGTTDPGTTDPGTTDPGTTDPWSPDPGTTDPGTTTPATPGTTVPGNGGAALRVSAGIGNGVAVADVGGLAETGGTGAIAGSLLALALILGGMLTLGTRRWTVHATRS